MKVLQINTVCGTGSTGRIATDIHGGLLEQGIESYIAYGRGEAHNCENSIKIGTNWDVKFHGLQTRIFDNHGFASKQATIKFIDEIKKLNPDVIHLHNIHGYYINIEILFNYLKICNKKIIWTLHDCWSFTGHCAHFDFAKCEKWRIECKKCPQTKTYPSSYVFDNSKFNYKKKKELFTGIKNLTIITPSKWLANLVKESFLKEYKVEVINNGIDTNIFRPTESNFRKKYKLEDKFIILGVASPWTKRKGFDDFLELSKMLKENEIIIMIGLSEKQLKDLPDNILGIKRTNNTKELAEIYSIANVFFNPTYEDNYPTVNLEALSCETPIITYNTGGSIECVEEDNGWIIKKGKIREVIRIIRNEKKEYILSEEKFNKDKFIINYIKNYLT